MSKTVVTFTPMKPGEYVVLAFVVLMLTTFFSLYIWFQVKRIKRNRARKQATEQNEV